MDITLISGSASAIQSAATQVYNAGGGTVYIPAGTFSLGGSFTIRDNVALVGAGIGQTVLNTSGSSQIPKILGNNARMSGFSLFSVNLDGSDGIRVGDSASSVCHGFRVDHVRVEGYGNQSGIYVRGDCTGVIDHCYIKNRILSSLCYGVVVYGPNVWQSNIQLGGPDAVYVEDCTILDCRHAIAANHAARYVFRHNTVEQCTEQGVDAHGQSSTSLRGTRSYEIYNNIIRNPRSGVEGALIRGGDGVIFNNEVSGYNYAVRMTIESWQEGGAYPLLDQIRDLYIWNNVGSVVVASSRNSAYYIQEGRDFYRNTRPGYVPYIYPHPLVAGEEPPPPEEPIAQFASDQSVGPAPLVVQFTDQSSGNITSRVWDFGDGSQSIAINPQHTFNEGSYQVILTVSGPNGSDGATMSINATGGGSMPAVSNLRLVATLECIGVQCNYSGTPAIDGAVTLQYRLTSGEWKTAFPMWCDTRLGQFKGSIFWLQPDTIYEVRVVGNNTLTGNVKTMRDNPPMSGPEVTVNPSTFSAALASLAPGTKLLLQSGNYSAFSVPVSGTPDNWISIEAAPGSFPVINGSVAAGGTGGSGGVVVLLQNYIRIKGLTVNSQIFVRGDYWPAGTFNYVRGIIIDSCIVRATINPIYLGYGVREFIVQNNDVTMSYTGTVEYGMEHGDNYSGIYWWNPHGPGVIRNNNVHGHCYDGIGGGQENNSDTNYVEIMDIDIYNNSIDWAADDGISLENQGRNTRVWNNLIHGGLAGIAMAPITTGPHYVFRNTIIMTRQLPYDSQYFFKMGDGTDGRIYAFHNTCFTSLSNGNGPTVTNSGLKNCYFRNNIFRCGRYVYELNNQGGMDFDFNCIYTSDPGRFAKWVGNAQYSFAAFQSIGQETHSININPAFINPGQEEFRITSGPTLNAGVLLPQFNDADSPWPYQGSAPDLGAIEEGGTPPPIDYILSIDTIGNGTTSPTRGTHVYEEGTLVSIQATPSGGNRFVEWREGGVWLGSNNPLPLTMNADRNITAVFESNVTQYTLTMGVEGQGTTIPSPGEHQYNENASVPISASPQEGWLFIEWRENGAVFSTINHITLSMTSDRSLDAVFEEIEVPPEKYTLSIAVSGNGTTEPADGSYLYDVGSQVPIRAHDVPGWRFLHWLEGDLTYTENPYSVSMDRNHSLIAVFEEIPPATFTLSIEVLGDGTTVPSPGEHHCLAGSEERIVAIPGSGQQFVEWRLDGDLLSTNIYFDITMSDDRFIQAVFEEATVPPDQYGVNIAVVGLGTTFPEPGLEFYDEGQEITIQVMPVEGWGFDHWEGSVSGKNPSITFNVNSNMSIVAIFKETSFSGGNYLIGAAAVVAIILPIVIFAWRKK